MMRIRRSLVLSAALALTLGAQGVSSAGDGGQPPAPGVPGDKDPPPDPAAEEKRKRIELDRRRDELPAAAKPAMALVDAFREKDFRVWGTLRREVTALGKDAVPALLIGLEELDWEVRAFAASCLGEMGDKSVVGHLGDAYGRESKFGEARRQIVLAAAKLEAESAVPLLVRALGDDEIGVRLAAMTGLGPVAKASEIDAIRKHANDRDLDLRYAARGNLVALGDEAAIKGLIAECDAVAAIEKDARTDSPYFRDNELRYSQYLLGMAMARSEDKRLDKLLSAIVGGDKPWDRRDHLRMGGAIGLGLRAARTGVVHPKLSSGITDKDDRVRVACSYGIGFAKNPEMTGRLAKALGDSRMDVRYNAVSALGRIGTDDAIEQLRRGLKDTADEVRVGAVRALGLVRTPAATKALVAALRDDKYMIRVLVARKLSGRTSEPAVLDALSRASKDQDYGVREAAIAALGHHGEGAVVLPLVIPALDDVDFGVQSNACLALAKVGPTTPSLADDDAVARRVVSLHLGASQPKLVRAAEEFLDAVRPQAAVSPLIEGLGHDNEATRKRANLTLLKITEKSGMGFDPAAPKIERDAAQRRWREWWGSGQKLPKRGERARRVVTGALADVAKDLKWKGLDIALLVDSTYSMSGLLNAAKERVDELAEDLADLLPSVRISMYTYRDTTDDYLFYGTPLTFDSWKLQGYLQYADAGQGRDIPEAVFDAVKNVTENLHWRSYSQKVVVYAGDAPHHPEENDLFMSFIPTWFTKDAQAVLHALYTDSKRRSLDIKSRGKREVADPVRYPVLETYARTAKAGRGKAVMLDDESALIKELLVLTFGDEWRADIENLLDFER